MKKKYFLLGEVSKENWKFEVEMVSLFNIYI